MPPVILDRLPLPSLQAYMTASIMLLAVTSYYTLQMTASETNANSSGKVNTSKFDIDADVHSVDSVKQLLHFLLTTNSISEKVYDILFFILDDTLCIWVCIYYPCMIILINILC